MPSDQMKTSMGTAAAQGCLKMLMMVFNFVFWITGVSLLVLGIWMKIQLYIYFQITTANYSSNVAFALIGIGAVIVVVGMLGCCCTYKGNTVLLYMYAAFLVIIFIAELASGIAGFVFKSHLEDNMKSGLDDAILKYDADKDIAKALDSIQSTLHCCGVEKYTDWFSTPWEKGQIGKQMAVPESCCDQTAPKCQNTNLPAKYTNDTLTIYKKGCSSLMIDFIGTNFGIMGGTVIGLAFFMLLGALLSCCLAKSINKAKYEQVA